MVNQTGHEHRKEFKFNDRIISTLMDTMPASVAVVAADGCVVFANAGLLGLLGLTQDDIKKGRLSGYDFTWIDIDGKKLEPDKMPFLRIIREGKPISGEIYLLDLPGKGPTYMSLNGAPYYGKDKQPIGAVFAVSDVDSLVRTERKLKETVEELSTFSHTLAHDMKTPLHTIISYIELIELRHAATITPEVKELMDFVVSAARRAYSLQKDLMEYLKIGQTPLKSERTPLNPIVDEIINSQVSVLKSSGREARFSHSELPEVMAAGSHMYELFQNLIDNAVKFVKPGAIPEVTISYSLTEDECMFMVRDNGIGIDPEYKDRLFNIFQRLHSDDEYPGTGIGLVVCKKIVSIYGGSIWFQSAPGDGTTFYFTLPSAAVCPPEAIKR